MTPEQGRALWTQLLNSVIEEPTFNLVLQHVVINVLVDVIEKRIELSDTFAVTIGERIEILSAAIENTL